MTLNGHLYLTVITSAQKGESLNGELKAIPIGCRGVEGVRSGLLLHICGPYSSGSQVPVLLIYL